MVRGGTISELSRTRRLVGRSSVSIDSSRERIMGHLLDVGSYPSWITAVDAGSVKSRYPDGRPRRVNLMINAKVKELDFDLELVWLPDGHEWSTVGDSGLKVEGSHTLVPHGDSWEVVCCYSMYLGFPMSALWRSATRVVERSLQGLKELSEA